MGSGSISRRDFLMYTGIALGAAAVAGPTVAELVPRTAARAARAVGPEGHRPTGPISWSAVPPELAARLQAEVDALAARDDLHHAVLAVESGDGAFRWSGAAGDAYAEGTPMTPDVPVFIASIDKLYVAAAVMRLCERGRVNLDDPIAHHLPAITSGMHVLDGVDHSAEVTVGHLLTHTSGLADYLMDRPRQGPPLLERVVDEGDRDWTVEETMDLLREELTPHFAPRPLDDPKAKVRYCDTNYQLLIELVERVEGATLDRVLADLLFREAGMRHTMLQGLSRPVDPATPEPATLRFGGRPLEVPRFLASLRSVHATVGDQIASLRAIVEGRVFERPDTLAKMQRWRRLPFPTDAAATRAPGWPVEYGYGMMRFQLPRLLTRMQLLPPVLGHTGSTGTWLFHCPELDVYVAGAVDEGTAGAVPYRVMPKILRILSEAGPMRV